jgi:putative flippase GtrA
MKIVNAKERERFIKFAVVGTIGAVVDFSVFNLASNVLGIEPLWANVISFTTAVISNFIWNRYWTYPDSRSKDIKRQLAEFFAVNLIGVLIRTPIFESLRGPLADFIREMSIQLPLTPEVLGNNLALAVSMVAILFWNYFVNRYWTYSDVES